MDYCTRCGRCCIEFQEQIHFSENEFSVFRDFITKTLKKINIKENIKGTDRKDEYLLAKLLDFFINSKWATIQEGPLGLGYYIPSKKNLNNELKEKIYNNLKSKTNWLYNWNYKECIFLTWKKKESRLLPVCLIHDNKPKMCLDYPKSKGGVCLNHPERKYTLEFFNYQKNKIGFAIKALKEIYREYNLTSVAYEILTLLMDFGEFSIDLTRKFINTKFNTTEKEFNQTLAKLEELLLIHNENGKITGISLKEIETIVDDFLSRLS